MKQKMLILLSFCIFSHAMEQPSSPQLVTPTIRVKKTKKERREQKYTLLLAVTHSMIQQKIDLNQPFKDGLFAGRTILTATATHRSFKNILQMALEAGADPNQIDGNTHSPLKKAVGAHCCTIFKCLIQKGAIAKDKGLVQDICGPWHDTLCKKKMQRRIKMLNTLLENGASANELDAQGNTSLYHLLWKWIPIRKKHSQNLCEKQRDIFYAQRKEMISILLKAGLNDTNKNDDGNNAIDNIGKHPHLIDHQLQEFLFSETQKNYAIRP